MLMWHRRLWLIDHGATLYFHHSPGWDDGAASARASPFPLIKDHVLLPQRERAATTPIAAMAAALTPDVIDRIVDADPGRVADEDGPGSSRRRRARGLRAATWSSGWQPPRPFVEEAVRVR